MDIDWPVGREGAPSCLCSLGCLCAYLLFGKFGLVVGGAMAARLPVVLSRACPWPQVEQWRASVHV
jgi:hypothetical protein